jgi:hypothetical protein
MPRFIKRYDLAVDDGFVWQIPLSFCDYTILSCKILVIARSKRNLAIGLEANAR